MPFGKGHLGKVAFCFRTPHLFKCDFTSIVTKFCNRMRLFCINFPFYRGKIATDILLLKKTLKFDIIYNTVQTGDTRKALALFGWSSCKIRNTNLHSVKGDIMEGKRFAVMIDRRFGNTESKSGKKFAVVIDGDNNSIKYIDTVMDEIKKEGVITYNRIYGDWTSPKLDAWKKVMLEYAITPMQQYSYTTGKNATDSAMIIDAMDILYTGNVDGFCIVSSDSDFTRLAIRLKEAGMMVIGMGRHQTPAPFVKACDKFKYVDWLRESETSDTKKTAKNVADSIAKESVSKSQTNYLEEQKEKIRHAIDDMIEENSNDDGWILASTVGDLLQRQFPDFDSRIFGYKKTINFIKSLGYATDVAEDKTTYYIGDAKRKKSK